MVISVIRDHLLQDKACKIRPTLPEYHEKKDAGGYLPRIMQACWAADADSRPMIASVKAELQNIMKSL